MSKAFTKVTLKMIGTGPKRYENYYLFFSSSTGSRKNLKNLLAGYVYILRREGESVSLTFPKKEISSKRETDLTWHRKDMGVIGNGPRLLLKYLRVDHSGEYFCKAEGKIVKTFAVRVYTRGQ